MSQIEKVMPTIVDEIEFYCGSNGEDTGMSHTGLFKFSGIARTTGQRLIGVGGTGAHHKFTGSLERWNTVSIFHENIVGIKDTSGAHGGRILKAEFCADFCTFAAYEYNGGNKIARYSLQKFATSGIKNFIQELSGYKTVSSGSEMQQILGILGNMQTKIDQMDIKLTKAAGYFKATVEYPGMENWLNDPMISEETLSLPDGDLSWYTLEEALHNLYPMMNFTKGNMISLGIMVAGAWRSMKGELPIKLVRLNDKGQKRPAVAAYPATFLPVVKNNVIKFLVQI